MRRPAAVSTCLLPALWVALALCCATPGTAGADVFGPISLVSEGPFDGGVPVHAEYAHDPAISADGRYVAFDGSIGGITGVWRAEVREGRVIGEIQQVAGGDGELPSISADGQYVSFTTNEGQALPEISHGKPDTGTLHQEAVNVYVRDMAVSPANTAAEELARPAEERAFTVVSAVNGSEEPLTYAGASIKTGSAATGRSAIGESPHGLEVAFVTTAVSNLVRYPQVEKEEEEKGETPKPHTPKLQVAVRYVDEDRTVLVSRCFVHCETSAEPAVGSEETGQAYGAVYPGHSASFEPPPAYGDYSLSPPPGASLSADGSTVAWMGENIGQQAALLPEETRSAHYTEPLWQRIEPGSASVTERVTGGSEPHNPACVSSGEGSLPAKPSPSDPCQGPFVTEEESEVSGIVNGNGAQTGDFVPRLNASGSIVAFVSEAPLVTSGENFGRGDAGQQSDLYVSVMNPSLTRREALTPITELAGGEDSGLADTAPIFDFDISPTGLQVAFATVRTRFPLGFPAFVSTPAGEPGMNELYDADLADGTLTLVTHGYQSEDEAGEHAHQQQPSGEDPYKGQPGDGALSPSFTADGDTLAFSSTASNLVFGDGNAPPLELPQTGSFDGSDAFVVSRTNFSPTPTPNESSPAPGPTLEPSWNLGVTASSRPNGTVLLYVNAPGAGSLRAGARGAVPIRYSLPSHSAQRPGARAARRGSRRVGSRRVVSTTVATRTLATATEKMDASAGGLITMTLKLAPAYSALASTSGGLSATVNLVFTSPGRPTLRQSIEVTFLRKAKRSISHSSKKKKNKHSSKASRRP
jgi:hypothetical protein